MEQNRPKIGLALGAGGVRGFAHIGVLQALEAEEIPIDFLAGSSMGALVAGLYGVGQSPEAMQRFATLFRRKYYLDFTVPKLGFIAGNKVTELIRLLAKGKQFEELTRPVAVVATDLKTGERVVFQSGDLATAIRASIAIPGVFVPLKLNGQLLIDGGVIDRVPISIIKEMGADLTIAVDVSVFRSDLQVKNIYDVIMQSMDIMAREVTRYQAFDCEVMIRPLAQYTNPFAFEDVEHLIASGKEAAYKQMEQIKRRIVNWKEHKHEQD